MQFCLIADIFQGAVKTFGLLNEKRLFCSLVKAYLQVTPSKSCQDLLNQTHIQK